MRFEDFVQAVIKYYKGRVTIVLFGSRARGDYWESSDYDVMVFLEKVDDPIYEASKLYGMKRGFSADILVMTPDKLNDSMVKKMLEFRKVLYDGLKLFTKV